MTLKYCRYPLDWIKKPVKMLSLLLLLKSIHMDLVGCCKTKRISNSHCSYHKHKLILFKVHCAAIQFVLSGRYLSLFLLKAKIT